MPIPAQSPIIVDPYQLESGSPKPPTSSLGAKQPKPSKQLIVDPSALDATSTAPTSTPTPKSSTMKSLVSSDHDAKIARIRQRLTSPSPSRPGIVGGFNKQMFGSEHPVAQLESEASSLWQHPVPTIKDAAKQAVMLPFEVTANFTYHPLNTIRQLTGGYDMARYVKDRNYRAIVGQSLANVLSVAMTSPETRAAATEGAETAAQTAKTAVTEGPRRAAQEVLGIGPSFIEDAERKLAAKVADYEADYADRVAHIRARWGDRVADQEAKYEKDVAAARSEYDREVAEQQHDYLEQKLAARQSRKEASQLAQRRYSLSKRKHELTDAVDQNVKETAAQIQSSLGVRWDRLRDAVGDAEADVVPLKAAVQHAKDSILQGSPENIRIFNSILSEGEPGLEDAAVFRGAGQLGRQGGHGVSLSEFRVGKGTSAENAANRGIMTLLEEGGEGGTITFNNLRGYYSELADKLSRPGMLGDVRRALRSVQDAVDTQIKGLTDGAGVTSEYDALKKEWRRYREDFRDMDPISQGGSPLSRIVVAQDPGYVVGQLNGKGGIRAIETLSRWKHYGADPNIAAELRRTDSVLSTLPKKIKVTAEPTRPSPEPFVPPERPTPPRLVVPQKKTFKPFDPVSARLAHLDELSARASKPGFWRLAWAAEEAARGNVYEAGLILGVPWAGGKLLKTEAIRWWLTKP